MTAAVLELILSFADTFGDTAAVIHISTAGNLRKSLLHGGVLVQNYPQLAKMNQSNKFKEVVIGSLHELLATVEILRDTLNGEPALVVAEGLGPLFLALRPLDSASNIITSSSSSSASRLVVEVLNAFKSLGTAQNVIIVWFSTGLSKNSGGLREGGPSGSWNQSLSNIWKEKCPRVVQYIGED